MRILGEAYTRTLEDAFDRSFRNRGNVPADESRRTVSATGLLVYDVGEMPLSPHDEEVPLAQSAPPRYIPRVDDARREGYEGQARGGAKQGGGEGEGASLPSRTSASEYSKRRGGTPVEVCYAHWLTGAH